MIPISLAKEPDLAVKLLFNRGWSYFKMSTLSGFAQKTPFLRYGTSSKNSPFPLHHFGKTDGNKIFVLFIVSNVYLFVSIEGMSNKKLSVNNYTQTEENFLNSL